MFGLMGIGSDGDFFTAQFQITGQNIRLRIGLTKALLITGCIDLQCQVMFNDCI